MSDGQTHFDSSIFVKCCDCYVIYYIYCKYFRRSTYVCPGSIWSTNAFDIPDFLVSAYSASRTSVDVKIVRIVTNNIRDKGRKKMGIKWKTKWDESKQLRSPRNKTGLERWKKEIQKNLIVWSLYRQLFLTSSFSPGESPFSTRNLLPLSAPSCSICGSWKCIFERRD